MAAGFAYTLLSDWTRADEGDLLARVSGLGGLKPEQRMLFLSDGSLTLELELLSGPDAAIKARVELQTAAKLREEAAVFLDEPAGAPVMQREVWLTAGQRLLVWAQTLIPIDRIDRELLNILEMNASEPLGRLLTGRRVAVCKDRLETTLLTCPRAALDLGLDEKTALMARRYVLSNRDQRGSWIIKAGITEIFSPELVPAPKNE